MDGGLPDVRPDNVRVGGGGGAEMVFTVDFSMSMLEGVSEEVDEVCEVCLKLCGRRLGGGGGALAFA